MVPPLDQRADHRGKKIRPVRAQPAAPDVLQDTAQAGIDARDLHGTGGGLPPFLDLLGRETEQEEIVRVPTALRISTFAPSRVPMVSAPLRANFMLLVPEASDAGRGHLLGEIGSGDDLLRQAHAVVRQKDHLQAAADGRVVVHLVGQRVD